MPCRPTRNSMESDDDRHRLPDFTFHEACLLTVQLTSQGLPDLHIAPEPTVRDELQKRTQREAEAVVQSIKQKVRRFLAGLSELNPSEFWDLDELRPKLESLSEMQLFGLYFALKKYFWEFEKHPTQAEAPDEQGPWSRSRRERSFCPNDGIGVDTLTTPMQARRWLRMD